MNAFYDNKGTLIKAYDMGDDWKLTTVHGERWFSTLSALPDRGLKSAFERMVDDFEPRNLVIC